MHLATALKPQQRERGTIEFEHANTRLIAVNRPEHA